MVDMAHFAGLVAGGVHPSPVPHAHVVTSTTHKTLRGPRGGFILTNDEDLAKKINSAVFPGMQGGPLMHVIAAKAVAFGEALRPSFKSTRRTSPRTRRRWPKSLRPKDLDIVSGGTDTHLMLVDLRPKRLTGKVAEAALGRAHITCNKNGIPYRSGEADGHLGHPPRHAGGHLARLRHRRVPACRRADRRGAGRAVAEGRRGGRGGRGGGAREGEAADRPGSRSIRIRAG